jgi:hypothetical protein
MAIKKYKPLSPDPYVGKTKGDTEFARLAHLNNLVDQVNTEFDSFTPPTPATPGLNSVLAAGYSASDKYIELVRSTGNAVIPTLKSETFLKVSNNYITRTYGFNSATPNHFVNTSTHISYNTPNVYNLWDFGLNLTSQAQVTPGNFKYKSFNIVSNGPGTSSELNFYDGFLTNNPNFILKPNSFKFESTLGTVEVNTGTMSGNNVLSLPAKTGTLAIEDTTAYTGSIVVGSQTLNFVNGILKTVV